MLSGFSPESCCRTGLAFWNKKHFFFFSVDASCNWERCVVKVGLLGVACSTFDRFGANCYVYLNLLTCSICLGLGVWRWCLICGRGLGCLAETWHKRCYSISMSVELWESDYIIQYLWPVASWPLFFLLHSFCWSSGAVCCCFLQMQESAVSFLPCNIDAWALSPLLDCLYKFWNYLISLHVLCVGCRPLFASDLDAFLYSTKLRWKLSFTSSLRLEWRYNWHFWLVMSLEC